MTEKISIGGSSIASVLGLSRWETPLKLWAELTGEIEREDISDREYVELGTELEDFVAKKFERKTGKKVRRDRRTFVHKDHECFVAHIDRRVQGTDELLECKTCSAWKEKEWQGEEIPIEYILQVQWYLGILGMKKGHIAVLIGGQKFRWKELDFDAELFDDMISRALVFVDMVKSKTPPVAIVGDKDVLSELFPGDHQLETMETDDENIISIIAERDHLKEAEKDAGKHIEAIENTIKQTMENAEIMFAGKFKCSWRPQTTRRLNTKKLKEEKPDIYDSYSYEKESRVFRVSETKEKKEKK